jgi:hypothetical protein
MTHTGAIGLAAAVLLLVALAATRGLMREPAVVAGGRDLSISDPPLPEAEGDELLDARTGAPSGGGLPEALLAMADPDRNTVLRLAIRDAGFGCDDVGSVQGAGDRIAGWRVSCGGALAYWVGVDGFGRVSVDPLPHRDQLRPASPDQAEPGPPADIELFDQRPRQ